MNIIIEGYPNYTTMESMSAIIIDGETVAGKICTLLIEDINTLKEKGFCPHLKAIQVGENAASRLYVQNQQKQCEAIGIKYTLDELSSETKEADLAEHIKKWDVIKPGDIVIDVGINRIKELDAQEIPF